MVYLTRLTRKGARRREGYPFSVPAVAALEQLELEQPITVLCGDNGCGKSTLMEILAGKLDAIRIGNGKEIGGRAQAIQPWLSAFGLVLRQHARQHFFFSAEDFIKYIDWVERTKAEAREELLRIQEEYRDKSAEARGLASMPAMRTLAELEGMYSESLAKQSHGEGFLDFFASRLRDNGLYLMDEPEGALSYANQHVLAMMMLEAVQNGCQFIVCTHSPVLAAIPGADLIELSAAGAARCTYEQLDSIRYLKMFLANPEGMFRMKQ
nr:AAA family ATPase [bacterium]